MLVTTANVAALNKGLSKIFQTGYRETPNFGPAIASTIKSAHPVEVHSFLKRLLKMREWIGPRVLHGLENNEYILRNRTFEESLVIPRDDIEDDSLGIYDTKMKQLAFAAKKWSDQLILEALQAGTANNSFDGVPFFSASHPIDPAGNQSNLFASTALTPDNFNTVRSAMASVTGEDGEVMGVMGNRLVVPPQLQKAALEISDATLVGGGNTNVQRGWAEVTVVPELANEPTVWYLMDTSAPIKPLIFQERISPELTPVTSATDEGVFYRNEFVWGLRARGAAGYGPWWLAARCAA